MPDVKVENFLISFAVVLAAAPVFTPALGIGAELFIDEGNEAKLPADKAAYAVVRMYGGEPPELYPGAFEVARPQKRSVQVMVTGVAKSGFVPAREARGLAERLYGAFFDAAGFTWHQLAISAKKIAGGVVADQDDGLGGWEIRLIEILQPPGMVGMGKEGRVNFGFNLDITFERKST